MGAMSDHADIPSGWSGRASGPARRGFHLGAYLFAQALAALAIAGASLLVDFVLISQGVRLRIAEEAALAGAFGFVFALPLALVIWRLGIMRLSHYLLCALAMFVPGTLATSLIYGLLDLLILPPAGYPWIGPEKAAAFELSVRLIRGGILAPIYLLVFWLVYQRWLKREPGL